VLTYAGKLNILASQMAEMLFTYRGQWVLIDCVDTYERYFGTTLELGRLKLCSIEELLNKPTFKMIVVVSTLMQMGQVSWCQGFHIDYYC